MKNKSLLLIITGAVLCPVAFAQAPKPLSESDLLKQIEALNPNRPAAAAAKNVTPAGPIQLFDPPPSDVPRPGGDRKDKSTDKKAKGPTEITSLEAVFDNKANIATFVGDVVVKDPEFNCTCDKLTAYLQKKTPAGAAIAPGTPAPATPAPAGAPAPKQRGGGLERAVAEMNGDGRVFLTQDKVEADGTVTHSFGRADRAVYDAITGDIKLYGSPEVIQGPQKMVAEVPEAVITINRDGRLSSTGKTKSFIVDAQKPDSR